MRTQTSCQWLDWSLSFCTLAKISGISRKHVLSNRSLILPLVWHCQWWYIWVVPFLPLSGLSTCSFVFWCQAPPHQSPESMLSLTLDMDVPNLPPSYAAGAGKDSASYAMGKGVLPQRGAEVLLLPVLFLAQPQIIHLCDIKMGHPCIILSQDIFLPVLKMTSQTPKGHNIRQLGKDTQHTSSVQGKEWTKPNIFLVDCSRTAINTLLCGLAEAARKVYLPESY